MNRLNHSLREELFLESYGGIFKNYPIFLKNFSENSLRKLLKIIVETNLMPGEEIFQVKTLFQFRFYHFKKDDIQDDCSIYLLMQGSVELFLNKSDGISTQTFKHLMVINYIFFNNVFLERRSFWRIFFFYTRS